MRMVGGQMRGWMKTEVTGKKSNKNIKKKCRNIFQHLINFINLIIKPIKEAASV